MCGRKRMCGREYTLRKQNWNSPDQDIGQSGRQTKTLAPTVYQQLTKTKWMSCKTESRTSVEKQTTSLLFGSDFSAIRHCTSTDSLVGGAKSGVDVCDGQTIVCAELHRSNARWPFPWIWHCETLMRNEQSGTCIDHFLSSYKSRLLNRHKIWMVTKHEYRFLDFYTNTTFNILRINIWNYQLFPG